MDFEFTVVVAAGNGQLIYKGKRARVLVRNKGTGVARLNIDENGTHLEDVASGSATLVEAISVRAVKESGDCTLDVRIECSGPIGDEKEIGPAT